MARRGRCSCNNCYHFLHKTAFLKAIKTAKYSHHDSYLTDLLCHSSAWEGGKLPAGAWNHIDTHFENLFKRTGIFKLDSFVKKIIYLKAYLQYMFILGRSESQKFILNLLNSFISSFNLRSAAATNFSLKTSLYIPI